MQLKNHKNELEVMLPKEEIGVDMDRIESIVVQLLPN